MEILSVLDLPEEKAMQAPGATLGSGLPWSVRGPYAGCAAEK